MTIKNISNHAKLRLAQRNLNMEDLEFVLRYGQEIHRTGAVFFFLGEKDIPEAFAKSRAHLSGSTVVANDKGIITVYRNRCALRKIKRKSKTSFWLDRRRRRHK